ncbi:MAG: helix-turn-helix transcriptional regulator [Kiritimatiellae bacterium]|nr:helix-turn-helix transcriptional regulator [Kiritimatiellia bacterium]
MPGWTLTRPFDCLFVVRSAGRASSPVDRGPRLSPITTPDFDLHYVTRGRGALIIDGVPFDLAQGDLCLVRPGETFVVLRQGDAFERIYVHFDAVRVDTFAYPRDPKRVVPFRTVSTARNSPVFGYCLRIVREAHAGADGSRALCSAVLTELLTRLMRLHARRGNRLSPAVKKNLSRLNQAREFIEANCERRLALAQIVAVGGLSVNYFSRLFRAYTGRAPYDYYLACKIDRAKELLIENALSVSQIAVALQFEDVHYFSRAFRKCAGMSPTRYQAGVQTEEVPGGRFA